MGGPRAAEKETPPVLTVAVILVLVLPKEKNLPRVQAERTRVMLSRQEDRSGKRPIQNGE